MQVRGWHSMSTTRAWSWQPVCILPGPTSASSVNVPLPLVNAIENSTSITYTSHWQLYLLVCKLHNCPTCPAIDSLSFYVVFMCHHINPHSVNAYLLSICNSLEPHFPDVWKCLLELLVIHTLAGMKLHGGHAPCGHWPLTKEDLVVPFSQFDNDDCLFLLCPITPLKFSPDHRPLEQPRSPWAEYWTYPSITDQCTQAPVPIPAIWASTCNQLFIKALTVVSPYSN